MDCFSACCFALWGHSCRLGQYSGMHVMCAAWRISKNWKIDLMNQGYYSGNVRTEDRRANSRLDTETSHFLGFQVSCIVVFWGALESLACRWCRFGVAGVWAVSVRSSGCWVAVSSQRPKANHGAPGRGPKRIRAPLLWSISPQNPRYWKKIKKIPPTSSTR